MKTAEKMIMVTAIAFSLAHAAFAADWTDANSVTYTALKSINGNASGYINTDIIPAGTEGVRFKYKTTAVSTTQCIYCSRWKKSSTWQYHFTCVINSSKFRVDRAKTQYTCNTAGTLTSGEEYSLFANYNTGTVTINGTDESGSMGTGTYTASTPSHPLVLLGAYIGGGTASDPTVPSVDTKANGDLYYFQLWSSAGALEHNFMPAVRDSNSVTGLYDTVTGTFHPATAGTFTGAAYGASERADKKWTGLGADNKMSNGANWEGGSAPIAGDDLDFAIAAPFAEIDADINATFGKVYLGAADLPAFTGSLTATGINDLARMSDYDTATAGFTFTLAAPSGQDFTWNGGAAVNWWATDVWTYNSAASSWYDNNNAIFNTANATATLDANASANSLAFSAPATIGGAATLTVPSVSVASGVSAAIYAPTAGAMTKTGAGTLTLGSSRSDATTLSEGTLAMAGSGTTLLMAGSTLGTDAAKPVELRFEGGAAPTFSSHWDFGIAANVTSTVVKAAGDWSVPSGKYFSIGGVNTGSGADMTFIQNGGSLTCPDFLTIGWGAADSTMIISGGAVTNSYTSTSSTANARFEVGYTTDGTLIVTNDASLVVKHCLTISGAADAKGVVDIVDGGTVEVAKSVTFGRIYDSAGGEGILNLRTGGTLTTRQILVKMNDANATAAVNFDGGTLKAGAAGTLIPASDKLTVSVSSNGGMIDNNALSVTLPCTITGAGGMALLGSGTTTVSADQSYLGTTTVSNETTLSVSGGVTFAGPVAFAAGSALNIADYVGGVTPLTAMSLAFPASGTVPLTFNGGAFPVGVYAICSASGLTATDGEKFAPSTGGETANWSVEDDTLVLTVGYVNPNAWTGRGGDGRMSTAANWAGNAVPTADADIDLSGISVDTTIIADANRTFGAVTMGEGVITFTNSFAATSFVSEVTANPTVKVAVGADSTVTIVGDLVFATNVACYVCYSIAEGGTFAVTGDIIATAEHTSYVAPCETSYNAGVISAKGLVNNINNNNGDYFGLARQANNALAKWAIGEDGLSGTKRFYIGNSSGATAIITATTNFTVSTGILHYRNLTLDTAGYEITLGTNTLAKSGGILRGGSASNSTTVTGSGKVIVNYNVNDLSTSDVARTNAFTVANGATLAFAPGGNIGFGALTVQNGGTLEIQSGTTTFGNLTVEENAILCFNFTDRRNAPVLALYDGAAVDAWYAFTVKVSGVWPSGGEKLLTTCGGFDGLPPLTLSAVGDAARWAKQGSLTVNADGNIVLDVRPMGTLILFR